MRALGDLIGVVFDEDHKKYFELAGGLKLERAEAWRYREDDGETNTKIETNVNLLDVNPQIATVKIENPDLKYKVGDVLFLHYLAYEEYEDEYPMDGEKVCFIDQRSVIFKFDGDGYLMPPNTYLAHKIIEEAPRTASGIYLTSAENVVEELRVRIAHLPENPIYKVGDEVYTMDKYNYPISVNDQEFFVLREDEIIAKQMA